MTESPTIIKKIWVIKIRSLAQAVRESLVLLKNNTLPMNLKKKFLVIGEMSKHIENQMGGWTITWQGKTWEGTSISNDDFLNTKSIYDSLSNHIRGFGGEVSILKTVYKSNPDYVIFVYGETPMLKEKETQILISQKIMEILKQMKTFQKKEYQYLLFISGRPMIVDKEINYSDAFVPFWLPGTL